MLSKSFSNLIRLKYLVFITIISAAVSCTKSGTGGNHSTASITGFSFQQSANSIPVNSNATINGTNILIFLPPNTNPNALVASFTLSDSGIVRVNGAAQQSGINANNFSAPVNYSVTSQNGTQQTYTVTLITGIGPVDQNVAAFMSKYNIPGMSLAITLNEKLVYVQAYGKSDVEDNQNATTNNLYRISSLSKQITSAAIMKLIDQGKIHMEDKVFGTGAILGTDYGSQPYATNITNINVGELLHHTQGGWPDNSTDPLGQNPSFTIAQTISWGLDNVPLLQNPGTPNSYYYSHFGYSILGRVIEKITGMSYTQAVQSLILQPSGITDMAIAGNTLADRLPNEVKYYDANNAQYSFNISRMDAANGWLATATDLARFLVHVDGQSSETILSPAAMGIMTTGSVANPNYGCGWQLNQYNIWHHGLLPGTGTSQAITTQSGNFNYVLLCNSGSPDPNFGSDLDNIFWSALGPNTIWPTYDLFTGSGQ